MCNCGSKQNNIIPTGTSNNTSNDGSTLAIAQRSYRYHQYQAKNRSTNRILQRRVGPLPTPRNNSANLNTRTAKQRILPIKQNKARLNVSRQIPNNIYNFHRPMRKTVVNEFDQLSQEDLKSWSRIHRLASRAMTPDLKEYFINYMTYLRDNFPCDNCKYHINARMTDRPIQTYYGIKNGDGYEYGVSKWAWEFHNEINQRLRKAKMSWEEYKTLYGVID